MTGGRAWSWVFGQKRDSSGHGEGAMSLAQTEVTKRKMVRAMLERLEPDTQSPPEQALHTRQELFGAYSSRAEEGFQQRCLARMCRLGLLDFLVAHPMRTRIYAVRDSSKVLDALTDDEALTRLIWHRPEVEVPVEAPEAVEAPESAPSAPVPSSSPGAVEDGAASFAGAMSEFAAAEGLQATTLKLLAGMVDSLYYLRLKIESIEQKIDALTQESK